MASIDVKAIKELREAGAVETGDKLIITKGDLTGEESVLPIGTGVQVAGGLAYIADGSSGLQILDVSVPAAPTSLGSFDTPGEAWDVEVAAGLAYVADFDGGLQILDVSDPAAPTAMGSIDTAVEAMREGAYHYVGKPFNLDEVAVLVHTTNAHGSKSYRSTQDDRDDIREEEQRGADR